MGMVTAMGVGFAIGLRHAMDADHVAAVATLLRREQGVVGAMRVGALWGAGHAATLLAVGAAIALAGVRFSEGASRVGEWAVSAMLIGLGVAGLFRIARGAEASGARLSEARSMKSAFGVGAVHGLAGTAGTALLAAASAGSGLGMLLFLALFGVGTVLGMTAMTAVLSAGIARAAHGSSRGYRALLALASGASVVVGASLAVGLARG
jgi:nickel/cobalt exporter